MRVILFLRILGISVQVIVVLFSELKAAKRRFRRSNYRLILVTQLMNSWIFYENR